ncbi:MAG: hypothetical protein ABEJ83_03640 [Candidatus Nanohaloarchaea archaeon]
MSKQFDKQNDLKSERIQFKCSPKLRDRLEKYSENNGISKSGSIRLILNQELPELEG